MKNIRLMVFALFVTLKLIAATTHYRLDLTEDKKPVINVEVISPEISQNQADFCFPAIIPGHYEMVDFGRLVTSFQAVDQNGNKLKVKKIDTNTFRILNAEKLYKIHYTIGCTNNNSKTKNVPVSDGSFFIPGKAYIFNSSAVFGYFSHLKNEPLDIIINYPAGMKTVSSLDRISDKPESFRAKDYDHLADSPFMISEPDISEFKLGSFNVRIAVYSETGEKVSAQIAKELKPSIQAVYDFCQQNMPVSQYTFFVCLKDMTAFKDKIYGNKKMSFFNKLEMSKIKTGALEHGQSSLFFFADAGHPDSYMYYLKRTSVHEMLHVFSPLNLKSEITAEFNFQKPLMSKHLWLYEGVTDYLAWKVKLKNKLIDKNTFINEELRPKLFDLQQFPADISFIDWSSKITEKPYVSQYSQVYSKGTVMAMLLDLEIIKQTEGKKDLWSVVRSLTNKYQGKAFSEDQIFDDFVTEVHPDLQNFFDKFIIGMEKPDYRSAFNLIGLDLQPKVTENRPKSLLNGAYGIDFIIERVRVYNIEKVSQDSPFQPGDKILYDTLGEYGRKPFYMQNGEYTPLGMNTEIPVIRNGENIKINVKTEYSTDTYSNKLTFLNELTPQQKQFLSVWLSGVR